MTFARHSPKRGDRVDTCLSVLSPVPERRTGPPRHLGIRLVVRRKGWQAGKEEVRKNLHLMLPN